MSRSLRREVLVATGLVTVLMVVGGTGIMHVVLEQQLRAGFDRLLCAHLRGVAAASEYEHGHFHLLHRGDAEMAVAVWQRGVLLAGEAVPIPQEEMGTLLNPGLADDVAPDGTLRRLAWASVVPHDDDRRQTEPVTVLVALSRTALETDLARLTKALALAGIGMAIGGGLALALVLRRALRPVINLTDDITRLDPRHPGTRLADGPLPEELRPLAQRVNDLCDRLEAAYGLASSMRGAAAHELRTPLAGLRATIEVAQEAGGDHTAALATCRTIVLQMQDRIDNLLMAARLDAGQLRPRREEVDAHGLFDDVWAAQALRVAERRLTVTRTFSGNGLAEADPEALRMVLANLVDNAVSHAPSGGTVYLEGHEDGAFVVLAVVNPAPALAPEQAERLFARGWRARSDDSARHAGLGLAICRELVGLMQGTITARIEDAHLRIEVRLPNAGPEFAYW